MSRNEALLDRVCEGLGLTPKGLARKLKVPYREVEDMLGLRPGDVSDIDRDEVWAGLSLLIDKRLGLLMAARADIQAKLQRDRKRRLARREAIRNR